ncbi:SpiroCoCo family coiled-coil protein [Candidatus Borreliella tachyglossi]|uniref:SpiroCoCo family coiled-coil protein n=1 Tax=Candidatus Borreliella tachyglossi TaxID=1964448 RepID=UPI004041185C
MIDFVTILVNLLLVFIVLLVYRQYDRRSRALDKIKKFIDIAKDNLEDFIDEKTKEINNLAVDMEAYQRSSIEIIKKIDEVQQKIKNKSNDFAEVEKKISYHDSMLKELDDMALKVQDNIQRLQVDGKIVDKLSKTLRGFNTQIDSIDSRLNSVFEKFDKTNKDNLEAIKVESWDKFDSAIKDLNLRMSSLDKELMSYQESVVNLEERKMEILDKGNDKLEGEFNKFLSKVESSINNYNKSIEDSFVIYEDKYKSIENSIELIVERVKTQINDKKDFILTRLNEELQVKFDEVFMYVDERSIQMRDKLEDKLILIDNEISSVSSVFKDNAYSRLNSIEETIKQEIRQYEEQVADIFDQFRLQIESNVGDVYKEYDNKINQFNKDIRERIDLSLEDANSRMESVQSDVKTLLGDLEKDSNKIYVEFKEKVKDDINQFSESVYSRMNDIGGKLESRLSGISADIHDKISKLDSGLYSDLKEINERLVNNYSYLDGSINSKYEVLLESLNLKSSELEIQMDSKYKNIADKLESDIDDFNIKYSEKFNIVSEKSNSDYQKFEVTSQKLEEEIRSLNDLLTQDFEILRRDFESNFIRISDDVSNEVSNLKSTYSGDIGEFVSQMESIKLQYEHWQQEAKSNLENIESHLNKTNEEFLILIEVQRAKGKELSENIFKELSEHIQKKAMDMHGDWKDELIALNKSLLDIKISSEEFLLSASSKVESLEKDVSERLEYVSSKTEDFENSVLEKYKELRDISYTKSDETLSGVKEFIDNQAEIIHDKVIMMLNGLNEGFSDKEELIKNKIEEFDYKLKDFKLECEDVLNNFRSDLDGFIATRLQKVSEIKIDNQKQIDNFLNKISEDILNRKDILNSEVDNKLNDWQGKLSEIAVNVENVLSSGKVDMNSINSEIALKVKDLKTTVEGLESYYLEKIDEFRNQGNIYSDELLKNIMNHFDADTKELEESLSKKFATVLEKSEEFVKEVDSLLQDKRTDITSFQANIDVTLDSLNVRFNDVNKEINDKYNEVISNARGYSEALSNKLENEIVYEIENITRRLTDKLDILSKNMDENLANFKVSFDVSKYQVENFEIKIKDLVDKEELRISRFLEEIEQQYKLRREEAVDYKRIIDNDVAQLRERFLEIINELKNNIEDKSEFLNDLYKERFKIIENNLEGRYSTFLMESEDVVSKIRDEIDKMAADNDENLRLKKYEMDRSFETIEKRSKEILEFEEGLRARIQENNDKINYQLGIIKSDIEKEMKSQFDSYIMKAHVSIDKEIAKYEHEVKEKISSLMLVEKTFTDIEKDLKDKIGKYHHELNKTLDFQYTELESKYNEKQLLIESKIDENASYIDGVISSKYTELESKYTKMHLDMANRLNSCISDLREELTSSNESMTRTIKGQFENLGELKLSLNGIEKDVIRLKEDSYQSVSSHLKLLEEDFFKDLKNRDEYLKTSLENFMTAADQRIDSVERDIIKGLEDKATLMNNFKVEIEQELILNKKNFYSEFSKECDIRKRDAENKISSIEISVAKRIDEFIAFIDDRQSNVDFWFLKVKDDMKDWQESAYKAFEERASIAERSVKTIESDVSDIENRLEVIKDSVEQRTKEIFGNLYNDIREFENSSCLNLKSISDEFEGRVLKIENYMVSKIESLDDKMNSHIEEIATQVEIRFLSQQKDIEDKIVEANQKLEDEFNLIVSRLETEKQELVSRFLDDKDSVKSRVEVMQDDVLKIADRVNEYRVDIERTIRENYESFASSMKHTYVLFENELKNSLGYSEEKIKTIKNSFKVQLDSIEAELKGTYKAMLQGVDDNISQFKLKVADYDSELNHFVDEVRNSLIVYKADLREELENRYATISAQIENFKKFEDEIVRNNELLSEAYSFKDKLEELWQTLTKEINLVQGYKNDFENLNREIKSIKDQSSDIVEVFNDLKVHQTDIKGVKEDFEQFLEFYGSFKDRYKKFIESYDEMQIYKTKLKEIRKDQNNILDNYDRISNKESILKSTIESVDKNFDLISEIENRMQFLSKESSEFQQSLGELRIIIAELLVNKNLSQEVLSNAQSLKEMLADIESKLEHTRSIRERVAKSETRLENLNVAAEERIKTLGILVKTDSKYKDNVGLNNEIVRDSVLKLMRQGWSASEISRATKLSVGEVELILELGISSKSDD